MGGMLGNKRQDRGKKFQGFRNFGGELLGKMQKKGGKTFLGECRRSCEPQQILGGNFWKNVKEKNLGGKFWGVVRRGACDAVGMVRNEKKGKFSPTKLGAFFRGGRIQGDVCGGDCWEIKDQIGGKKISGGPEIFGG